MCPNLYSWQHAHPWGWPYSCYGAFHCKGKSLTLSSAVLGTACGKQRGGRWHHRLCTVDITLFSRMEKINIRFCQGMSLAYVIWTLWGGLWIPITNFQVADCSVTKQPLLWRLPDVARQDFVAYILHYPNVICITEILGLAVLLM